MEPGDEDQGPSRGQEGLGAEVSPPPRHTPSPRPPGRRRAGGLDRVSALARPSPSTDLTQSAFHGLGFYWAADAAPEVWLTPLRKQFLGRGQAGGSPLGTEAGCFPLPAGGRRRTDLEPQQPGARLGLDCWDGGWRRRFWSPGQPLTTPRASRPYLYHGELCVD